MSEARNFSIRRFLLVSLTGTIALLWSVSALLSYRDARHEVSELFDAQLAESAKILLAEAAHEISELKSEPEFEGMDDLVDHRYGQRVFFQIWAPSGRLLMRSDTALTREPLSTVESGYSFHELAGRRYRTFALWDKSRRLQIQVAQFRDTRERFSRDIALHILAPLLFALPLLALLILWSVNRGLKPLMKVTQQVAALDPQHLEPVSIERCPTETKPLLDSVNSLLKRLKDEFEKERRFTSDASHELRTPLAALRAQAEVALNASQADERKHALGQIIRAVDRTSHLVGQLLTLARLDPESTLEKKEEVNLGEIAKEVLKDLAPEAVAKRIELGLRDENAVIRGNPAMLSILVRNLVDNAIRYTPQDGEVRVSLYTRETSTLLEIQDSGPGIPVSERERVFERFYRIPGTQAEGSGLGFSIAKRIVDLHEGSIELGGPPGLLVRVIFRPSDF